MPKKITKDLMGVGIHHKGNDPIYIPSHRLTDWDRNFKRMSEKGYKVPVWFEHPSLDSSEAYPVKATDTATIEQYEKDPHFVGWVDDITTDGNTSHHTISALSDELADKAVEFGSYVSPQVGEWKDHPDFGDCVHHVALTKKPVNKSQSRKFDLAQFSEIVQYSLTSTEPVVVFASEYTPELDTRTHEGIETNDLVKMLSGVGVTISPTSPLAKDTRFLALVATTAIKCLSSDSKESDEVIKTEQITMPMSEKTTTTKTSEKSEKTVDQLSQELETLRTERNELKSKLDEATTNLRDLATYVADMRTSQFSQDLKSAHSRLTKAYQNGQCSKAQYDRLIESLDPASANVLQFSDNGSRQQLDGLVSKIELFEEIPEGAFHTPEKKLQGVSTFSLGNQDFHKGELTPTRVNEILDTLVPMGN